MGNLHSHVWTDHFRGNQCCVECKTEVCAVYAYVKYRVDDEPEHVRRDEPLKWKPAKIDTQNQKLVLLDVDGKCLTRNTKIAIYYTFEDPISKSPTSQLAPKLQRVPFRYESFASLIPGFRHLDYFGVPNYQACIRCEKYPFPIDDPKCIRSLRELLYCENECGKRVVNLGVKLYAIETKLDTNEFDLYEMPESGDRTQREKIRDLLEQSVNAEVYNAFSRLFKCGDHQTFVWYGEHERDHCCQRCTGESKMASVYVKYLEGDKWTDALFLLRRDKWLVLDKNMNELKLGTSLAICYTEFDASREYVDKRERFQQIAYYERRCANVEVAPEGCDRFSWKHYNCSFAKMTYVRFPKAHPFRLGSINIMRPDHVHRVLYQRAPNGRQNVEGEDHDACAQIDTRACRDLKSSVCFTTTTVEIAHAQSFHRCHETNETTTLPGICHRCRKRVSDQFIDVMAPNFFDS